MQLETTIHQEFPQMISVQLCLGSKRYGIEECRSSDPLFKPVYEEVLRRAHAAGWVDEENKALVPVGFGTNVKRKKDGQYYFTVTMIPQRFVGQA